MDFIDNNQDTSEETEVVLAQRNDYKRKMIEALWLHYFNDTLRAKGLISEREYIQMKLQINLREPPKPRTRMPSQSKTKHL